MKRLTIFLATLCLMLTSCITEDTPHNTPEGNFDYLWKILDEHYCFFAEKNKLYGVDWNDVYARYKPQVRPNMSNEQLFTLCAQMLYELRDGHVNLTASHDMARYWKWYEDYPTNFSDSIQRIYMGTDYRIAGGMRYRILGKDIGYMRVSTFENAVGSGNVSEMLRYFALCKALIIDVRNNGGGMITSAEKLASHFVNAKALAGYICHKNGKGHSDFSSPKAVYLTPATGIRWLKPVFILTNRQTYSAANTFVMYMKNLAHVKTVGDKTGGGAGMPFNSELPNGWSVRFSACPMFDAEMQDTEAGIDPDIKENITTEDYRRGIDTIIETAIKVANTK